MLLVTHLINKRRLNQNIFNFLRRNELAFRVVKKLVVKKLVEEKQKKKKKEMEKKEKIIRIFCCIRLQLT